MWIELASLEESLDKRLVVGRAHPFAYLLPYGFLEEVRKIEGVEIAAPRLGAGCRQPASNQSHACFAVEPESLLAVLDSVYLPSASLTAFSQVRTGAVVTDSLAAKLGWQIGDAVSVTIMQSPRKNGSDVWEFQLVGVLTSTKEETLGEALYYNIAYLDEGSAAGVSTLGAIQVVASSVDEIDDVSKRIDNHFSISSTPTMTVSRSYLARNSAQRLGDLNQIITLVLSAALFSVLIVAGNTSIQGARERTAELATMKAMGFSDGALSIMLLKENVMLCFASAMVALAVGYFVTPIVSTTGLTMLGRLDLGMTVVGLTLAIALVLALMTSLLPVMSILGRSPSDGLRDA